MSGELKALQAEQQLAELGDLEKHPGFKCLCARYDEIVAEMIKKILDTTISDQETHDLKQQLTALRQSSPQTVTNKMREKARKSVTSYSTRK